jgi:aspartate aminotransferase
MPLSRRAAGIPASPIRKLVPLSEQAKARGVHVHHLNIGQPDIETPRPVMEAMRRYDTDVLAYGPSVGIPELQTAVAQYYARLGHPIDPRHVFVTTGASEGLCNAFAAIGDPGDELLVFEPFYANYNAFAIMLGLGLRAVATSAANGHHLPPDEVIERAIGPRTRAIIVGSPGNPSGVVYRADEIARLARIAEARNLYLIADEVYREFAYDGAVATSALSAPNAAARVIVVDSISKRFSACGARVGFLIAQEPELCAAVTRMAFARLCPATIEQIGAIAAYGLPPDYFAPVIAEYQRRRNLLVEGLSKLPGVTAYRPEGAFYAMVTLPVDDADRFCAWLLSDFSYQKETVMLAPGSGFYATPGLGRHEARVAYVLNTEALARSIEVLGCALEAYPGRR